MDRSRLPHREEGQRRRLLTFGDVVAGVSVAVLLIPQSLAYANLAGMPPYIGLYAAALPPLAAAFFASSPYLQTGPVALTSLLTFGALSTIADPGSPEYVALGGLLAVIVGLTRVAIGLSKAGDIAFLIKLFPLKMHPNAYDISKSIVCNKSMAMLELSFAGKPVPPPLCETSAVDQTIALAEDLGIRSTPTLVLADGLIVPGYKQADALLKLISENAQQAAVR